jgi:hypothetical protein
MASPTHKNPRRLTRVVFVFDCAGHVLPSRIGELANWRIGELANADDQMAMMSFGSV